jgi:hypothetical protein
MSRQLDMPGTSAEDYTVPRDVPGRLSALDFVKFVWPANVDPARYSVVVESNDSAGPRWRKISNLAQVVELPNVQYGWESKIGVIPDAHELPAFQGTMYRGSIYVIPNVTRDAVRRSRTGVFKLEQHGMQRPSGL